MIANSDEKAHAEFLHRVSEALGDRYRIDREIGAGATAIVYLAHDLKHGRQVAVKVLRPELSSTLSSERFEREIVIAAGLTHPNILPVYDSGAASELLFYVMPYVEGETLAHRIEREGRLPLGTALRYAREIAAALQHAHDRGVVHRDIKPANILLSGDVAVVADFGLARAIQSDDRAMTITLAGSGLGTPAYMSPEQALGSGEVHSASDQYSLGCLLYEMLAGQRPFDGKTFQKLLAQHVSETAPDPRVLRPEIPEAVATGIMRAMSKDPADRFDSLSDFVNEAAGDRNRTLESLRVVRDASPQFIDARRAAIAVTVVVVVALGLFAWLRRASIAATALDKNLIAVAPFTVIEPQLAVWREGLAEVVAHNLDGAGPLRTISMTVASRGWKGSWDKTTLVALGRRTNSAYAVSGRMLQAGADSVHLTATVFDVGGDRQIGDEIDLFDLSSRIDRLSERVTVEILARLGQSKGLAEARLAAARSTPLPALKSFLQAEYFFRRTLWDSAMVHYQRAVELDSTMSLAFVRMSMVSRWQRFADDEVGYTFALRAQALNRGLAPRESLLVEAEALKVRALKRFKNPDYIDTRNRLAATIDNATLRYPDDRELWYSLGATRKEVDLEVPSALAAYDRAIAIDSGFAPAYLDAVTLALALGSTARARTYLDGYLALQPGDVHGDGLRLAARLLDPRSDPSTTRAILDTASADILVHAIDVVAYWPDSAENAINLARLLRAGRRSTSSSYTNTDFTAFQLGYALAFRGHLSEAALVMLPSKFGRETVYSNFVAMGALSPEAAKQYFNDAKSGSIDRPTALIAAQAWWADRRDTTAIRESAERAEQFAANQPMGNPRRYATFLALDARAYLALAKGDTSDALTRFLALPSMDCIDPYCIGHRLTAAQLLSARGRDVEALRILDIIPNIYLPLTVRWRFERARVAEKMKRADAEADYRYVAELWRNADAPLQPIVKAALEGANRLAKLSRR